ncbi:MAG: hypothetical protein ACKOXB_02280 [Flavobacteriales bacterium]
MEILCKYCGSACMKYGRDKQDEQRYRCKSCGRVRKEAYRYRSYALDLEREIVKCIRNGVGMRGMSNITEVSLNTLKKKIIAMSKNLNAGMIPKGKTYQVDELKTYVMNKMCISVTTMPLISEWSMPVISE